MKIKHTNDVKTWSNSTIQCILLSFLIIAPTLTNTLFAQSAKDQSTLESLQFYLELKNKYNKVCDNYRYHEKNWIQVEGMGTVMVDANNECQIEMSHCRKDRDARLYEDMIDDPTYQRCAKAFWRYVEIGRIDLINKMDETQAYVPEDPLRGQNNTSNSENSNSTSNNETNQPSQNTSQATGGGSDDSFDIDDLSAEDIEIMDVKPEEQAPASSQGKYCPCKGGDQELYGLCITPDGQTYFPGQFPWTEKCYTARGIPKKND